MKTTGLKLKTVTVLATLAFLSISVQTIAADFIPLDVWEEIEAWEQTITAGLDPDSVGYDQTMPMGIDDAEMVNASFPFDVWEELNDLGDIYWRMVKNWNAFNLNYGTAKEDTTTPYGMPEAYKTQ